MTLSQAERDAVEIELGRGRAALSAGNDGKARVCARRASGVALRAWYRASGRPDAPPAAQSLLNIARADPALPAELREAAVRLTTSINDRESLPFSGDPLGDAAAIIAIIEALPGPSGV